MLLKGTNSRNSNFEHPNFGISELRTSRTLLLSPKVELNELELQKSRTVRTRTQVRSITNFNKLKKSTSYWIKKYYESKGGFVRKLFSDLFFYVRPP